VERLLLEAHADEVGGDLLRAAGAPWSASSTSSAPPEPVGRAGGPHQISIPNCRRSARRPQRCRACRLTPLRSMSARSMPMPKAKPLVDVRVDPGGAQHVAVDHPAATPLDPAEAAADATGRVGRRGRPSTGSPSRRSAR
jgi:hypothetical protein